MGLLPFDKFATLFRIIKQHGGLLKSTYKLWITDTLKDGVQVGIDCYGNKYFENYNYMIGRCRWVEYNPAVSFEYDGSQVDPAWFGWLHYKTDTKPCDEQVKIDVYCNQYSKKWILEPQENTTQTDKAFYPYSTVKERVQIWDGV